MVHAELSFPDPFDWEQPHDDIQQPVVANQMEGSISPAMRGCTSRQRRQHLTVAY
jgi:hypothetical protein